MEEITLIKKEFTTLFDSIRRKKIKMFQTHTLKPFTMEKLKA